MNLLAIAEPITEENFPKILSEGESQTVEFKNPFVPLDALSILIAGFANSESGGSVLFGIQEQPELNIVGADLGKVKLMVEKAVATLTPMPAFVIDSIAYKGSQIITVFVPPSDESPIVTRSGQVPIRTGERTLTSENSAKTRLAGKIDFEALVRRAISNTDTATRYDLDQVYEKFASTLAKMQESNSSLHDELQQANKTISNMDKQLKANNSGRAKLEGIVLGVLASLVAAGLWLLGQYVLKKFFKIS